MNRTLTCMLRPLVLVLLSLFCATASAVSEGILEANGATGLITGFDRARKEIFVDGSKFYISSLTKVARQDGTPMSMLVVKTGMLMQIFIDRNSVTSGVDAATLERLVFIRMEDEDSDSAVAD